METAIKPLADRVVVRPLTDEEAGGVSPSGIIIPDTAAKEKNDQGVVVAIGEGRWNEDGDKKVPLEVKVGNKVLFKSWSEKVKIGKEEYWVIPESDILGVISN